MSDDIIVLGEETAGTEKKEDNLPEVVESEMQQKVEEENTEDKEVENSEEDNAEDFEQQEDKKPKLTGSKRKQLKIERLERELELERQKNQTSQKAEPKTGEPILDDYDDINDYIRDFARYEAKNAVKQTLQEKDVELKKQTEQQTWASKEAEFVKTHNDYAELLEEYDDYEIRNDIVNAVRDSEIGVELQYHLMKNPDLLDSINSPNLSTYQILSKIAKIEASLSSSGTAQKPLVKISKAPPPIEPVRGYSSKSLPNLETMSVDEFIEYRNKTVK